MPTKKYEKPEDKVSVDEAREIVRKDDAASKDGVTRGYEDSGITYRPDPNDKSVATYDPNEKRQKPEDEK